MSKRRLYFHVTLIVIILGVGGYSIWEIGLNPEGKNHPNFSALAMVFLVIGQIVGFKAYQSQRKKDEKRN